MPKINLAQETMRNQAIARRRKVVYLFSIVVLVIVGAFYFGVLLLTKNSEGKVAEVDKRIKGLEQQIKSREVSAKQIKAFSMRLVNVESLLKNHTRWSTTLSELERLVLPSVSILGLNGGADTKEITMDVSAPTIETAADLVVSLESEAKNNETFFSNVIASSLGSSSSSSSTPNASTVFATKLKFIVKPEGFLDKNISVSSAESPAVATPVNPLIP
ncbi:MAG: hypothetical protein Q7S57_05495 [bacterium]|nr:hypothetical protein [bacterium]